ncbi:MULTISPECIES: hypothetical protein [Planococcus]|uniref:Diguanylate cyclase n=1 Tax=Planococcus rifietoensis TaxID=200991 RepID=A0A0U2QBI4_9BACL|nr:MULTISPECIES: hypothetical protein [Planococcus]ALS76550.1 hypothetical protein AUC31_15640 [Planococcus rifietoensis]AUD14386.1 hypothetical protein CW734_12995 [Planococcus sp. MB-3u-03]PKG46688.1 hypothetical protein CXF66_06340 [Planococcus sp. Urea-trap-24]PKG89459.1 hypothetical protein CXF91_07095 [Planococcus sp. Urea-3u-39]PKH39251.1 hypothetical protein CXF77_10075 [Planococcus sp. MB-3u-09]
MKNNLKLGILILMVLGFGWALFSLVLPFSTEMLLVAGLSILFMTLIHERYVFLYGISIILSYGVFLTVFAFFFTQRPDLEIMYVYSHLLFTGFILSFWLLLNQIKQIGYEASELRRQVQLLQKYHGETDILTVNEFTEQAQWVLKTTERRQEEAWFVEITINTKNKRTQQNIKESLERATLSTIRQKFDLATSTGQSIYLLLKDIDEEGVRLMMERYRDKVKQELNLLDSPYEVRKEQVSNLNELSRALGRAI